MLLLISALLLSLYGVEVLEDFLLRFKASPSELVGEDDLAGEGLQLFTDRSNGCSASVAPSRSAMTPPPPTPPRGDPSMTDSLLRFRGWKCGFKEEEDEEAEGGEEEGTC